MGSIVTVEKDQLKNIGSDKTKPDDRAIYLLTLPHAFKNLFEVVDSSMMTMSLFVQILLDVDEVRHGLTEVFGDVAEFLVPCLEPGTLFG